MTPAQFRDDHEAAFASMPHPSFDPADVTALSTGQLQIRMRAGTNGAIAARRELHRRITAQLRQEMGARR